MNITTIEVTAEEAESKLAEYEGIVRSKKVSLDHDEALRCAYKAVRNGGKVIHLAQAIRGGGTVEVEWERDAWREGRYIAGLTEPIQLPSLACAPAHASRTFVATRADGDVTFCINPDSRAEANFVRTEPNVVPNATRMIYQFAAMVPLVPPALRPTYRLHNYHILWEVEEWVPVTQIPSPPRDPLLLKHAMGQLYVVMAEWDLTEMERAVIAGR